jgi:N-acetylglucosamine-6-sulfatase
MRLRVTIVAAAAMLIGAAALAVAAARPAGSAATAKKPNIVFVLTDDLAWNLVKYMPHVQALQKDGMTFSRYYVTDSLCCPSRSSIFSGRFPHDTWVFTNMSPDGGFGRFQSGGEERSTFATALQAAHYRTAMMGKYLNGYTPTGLVNGKPLYVPLGWNEWDVAGNGYGEFNYNLNENGKLVAYGNQPQDYLTDVISGKAVDFINRSADAHSPFMIELATFAPHQPATPAPRDANDFPGLKAPRSRDYDVANTRAPRWLSGHPPLTPLQVARLDALFRKRAQSIQAVDDMIGRIEATLRARGLTDNTYIVFSSDNGFHLGDHRLLQGKMTAFDTDIRVPLIVAGPGVPAGRTTTAIAQNVDLRPTFSQLGGASVPANVDGHSLVRLLRGGKASDRRRSALVEHHGPDFNAHDPDLPAPGSGNPTSYEALRTAGAVYVEYADGEREYYNLARDPNELHNTYARLGKKERARLHNALRAAHVCHGGKACWAAQRKPP